MKRRGRILAGLLALGLLMSACGGDDDDAAATTDTGGTTTDDGDTGDGGTTDDGGMAGGSVCPTSDLDELVELANAEGELTWYVAPSGVAEPTIAAFEEKYPEITVESLRATTAELNPRFAAEAEAGTIPADVFVGVVDGFIPEAVSKGWMVPPSEAGIPGFENFPAEWDLGDEVVPQVRAFGFGYNHDLVENPPETWEDLLDPSFTGEIILADPRAAGVYPQHWDALGLELGDDFIAALGEQDLQIFESGSPAIQAVAAGEALVEIPATGGLVASVADEGAPVTFFTPDITTGSRMSLGMPIGQPHPAAGCLFASYLLSEEGQQVFNDAAAAPSMYNADELPDQLLEIRDVPEDRQQELYDMLGVG